MPFAAALSLAALLLLGGLAYAADPINKTWFGSLAIDGYDAVAYFTEGKPVKGSSEHEFGWRDATWRFSSPANKDRFVADPERYAPQYGGYCAYAVANGTVNAAGH